MSNAVRRVARALSAGTFYGPRWTPEWIMEGQQGLSLDHVFLAVSRGGPEIEPLLDAGFTEVPPNVHPGQGTASRRFFFDNAYLEFAWLENHSEATAPRISPTGLAERLGERPDASRVGICVRLSSNTSDPPVPTWAYRPPYLPASSSIPMGTNAARPEEPLLFFLPAPLAPSRPRTDPHANGARAISRVALTVPPGRTSSPHLARELGPRLDRSWRSRVPASRARQRGPGPKPDARCLHPDDGEMVGRRSV